MSSEALRQEGLTNASTTTQQKASTLGRLQQVIGLGERDQADAIRAELERARQELAPAAYLGLLAKVRRLVDAERRSIRPRKGYSW